MIELQRDGLSRRLAEPQLRVLSLGAGVQSTTLALMAARGEIEAPDCAIFADTGDEPAAVYEHLAWLQSGVLPFPIHIAKRLRPQTGAHAVTPTPDMNPEALEAAIPHQSQLAPAENKFHVGNGDDGKHYWLTPPMLYAALDAEAVTQ